MKCLDSSFLKHVFNLELTKWWWSLGFVLKIEDCLKQHFLLVEIRSIHLPLSFKNVLVSNKLNKLNDYINYVNAEKFGSILKSSKKI